MPKRINSKTETEQVVPTSVVVDSSVSCPSSASGSSASGSSASASASSDKKKKTKAVKVEDTVPPPVVSLSVDSTNDAVMDSEISLGEQSVEFLSKLQQLGVLISSLKAEYRSLEKKYTREIKTAQKQCSKRKRKTGNRAPSGFVKPTKISSELASFLGKDKGTEMARTEVTREINTYIRAHKLQDVNNGRKINPDAKLASLLKLSKTDELTYFNLQKFMSPHFAKAPPKITSTATV